MSRGNAKKHCDEAPRADRGMRVLILVENLPVPFDRRVWQEAQALKNAGYDVTVICPKGPDHEKGREVIDGIHIHRYRQLVEGSGPFGYLVEYGTALLCSFALSLRVLTTRGFDIVHACNPPDLFFLIGGFFKLFGKKFVFDHHDINPELYEAKFQRHDTFYRLLLKLESLSFRTADAVISTNESYRRIAVGRGRVPPSKVFVVRSGPSLRRMKRIAPDPALKMGRRFLVGYVGVIGEQEGIDRLLRAVHHIVFDLGRRDIHFGLVGGGTALEEMKVLADSLGIAEYVTFTGRVPDDEMLSMLNTADICVNPDPPCAMNDKSTMNKIMEYMALGKAIVQFDLTEGRFSAQNASLYAQRDGFHDFADKIITLLDDPVRRHAMGELGRRRVLEELAWRHQVPALLACYQLLWPAETVAMQRPRQEPRKHEAPTA